MGGEIQRVGKKEVGVLKTGHRIIVALLSVGYRFIECLKVGPSNLCVAGLSRQLTCPPDYVPLVKLEVYDLFDHLASAFPLALRLPGGGLVRAADVKTG